MLYAKDSLEEVLQSQRYTTLLLLATKLKQGLRQHNHQFKDQRNVCIEVIMHTKMKDRQKRLPRDCKQSNYFGASQHLAS